MQTHPQWLIAFIVALRVLSIGALCTNDPTLIREARIDAVKHELLERLHLSKPPENPEGVNDSLARQEHCALTAALQRQTLPCVEAFSEELLVHFPTGVTRSLGNPNFVLNATEDADVVADRYHLKFQLDLRNKSTTAKSELRIFGRPVNISAPLDGAIPSTERIELYLLVRPERHDYEYYDVPQPVFLTYKHVATNVEGFVLFDISYGIERWMETNELNLRREIEFDVVVSRIGRPDPNAPFQPYVEFEVSAESTTTQLLVPVTENREEVRKKRMSSRGGDCDANCCLRPLTIHFERDFGWTWIRSPEQFQANYCEGLCPTAWASNTHTLLLGYFTDQNPTAAPSPCCVPHVLQPLVLLIVVNGTLQQFMLDDMTVKSCICR